MATTLSAQLPSFPWDSLTPLRRRAAAHPDGLIDLSIGAPVDPVPAAIRRALADSANAPGYPSAHGDLELRTAYAHYLSRAHQVTVDPENTVATVGSKEFIASLPLHLGLGGADIVAIPRLAYPTYEIGAQMVGASVVRADTAADLSAAISRSQAANSKVLVWLNSPSNPTGAVLDTSQLRDIVTWARRVGATVASDECYLDLGWDSDPQSILSPQVAGEDHTGLIAIHSASKRSNLAGYRLGFAAGDPHLLADLVTIRKHCGLVVPQPVQDAGKAAFADDAPVLVQRGRYEKRRARLATAIQRAGFTIAHSEAGLYLWATCGLGDMATLGALADCGILAAPGSFYGPTGLQYVRLALTATDEAIAAAAARIGLENFGLQ